MRKYIFIRDDDLENIEDKMIERFIIQNSIKDSKQYPKSVLSQSNVILKGNILSYFNKDSVKLFKVLNETDDSVNLDLMAEAYVRPSGEIVNIFVDKSYRGQRLGQTMAELAKDKLNAKFAITIDINEASRKTFKNAGFEEVILPNLPKFIIYVLPEYKEQVLNSNELKSYVSYLNQFGESIYKFNKSFITDKKIIHDSYCIVIKED